MDLDRVSAALRPRRPWEGLDLGFVLGRTWFRTLWPLWWIAALPLAIVAIALVGARADRWVLALWWLKPVYEAPLAIWIGRALFGDNLGLSALGPVFRAAWSPRLLPFLLWRRLSPSRSFVMPIALLEGLGGRDGRRRCRILSGGGGTAGWLTVVCWHFESILWLGLLLGAFFIIPEGLPRLDLQSALTQSDSWPYWASCVLFLLAASIIAPFYVGAGFALYLTRRTELEAWDLELGFRRAHAERSAGPAGAPAAGTPGRKRIAALAVLGATLVLAQWPGGAPLARELRDPAEAHRLIGEVLSDRAFGSAREIGIWVPVGGDREESRQTPAWLQALVHAVAGIGPFVKWTLIAVAVAAVVVLAWRVARDWRSPAWWIRGRRSRTDPPPEISAAPAGLPADPAAEVRARLAQGDTRGALALLYRGGIAQLQRLGVEIPPGATEGECLARAAHRLPAARLVPFRELTRDWQALAYAHRVPSKERIALRIDRWLAWNRGQGEAADGATPGAGQVGP